MTRSLGRAAVRENDQTRPQGLRSKPSGSGDAAAALDPRRQVAERRRAGQVRAQRVPLLARAVVVAGAGPDQAEPGAHLEQQRARVVVVVRVVLQQFGDRLAFVKEYRKASSKKAIERDTKTLDLFAEEAQP